MSIQEWLLSVALKKGAGSIAKVLAAWLLSGVIQGMLKSWGLDVQIDETTFQAALTAFLAGGWETLRNFLKHKYGIKIL